MSQRQCEKQQGGQLEAARVLSHPGPSSISHHISGCFGCRARVTKVCPGCRQLPSQGGENPGLWMGLPVRRVPSLLLSSRGLESGCSVPRLAWGQWDPPGLCSPSKEELVWDWASPCLCLLAAGGSPKEPGKTRGPALGGWVTVCKVPLPLEEGECGHGRCFQSDWAWTGQRAVPRASHPPRAVTGQDRH